MYTDFFGFSQKPFALTSDPQVFYSNPVYQRAYATLLYGLCERKDLVVFTGEVGTGKTTLLRRVMQHLGETTHFLFFSYTTLPFDDIVGFLCQELQVPVKETARRHQKIVALKEVLLSRARQSQNTVLVIDEAQNFAEETLTALVSLCLGKTLAEPLLSLVLAGQPEFEALLRQSSLRQISQRITLHCRLDRLKDGDVAPYILHRLHAAGHEQQDIFTPEALQRIVTYSAGIPRKINLICDNALLLAYSDMHKTVSAEMIDEVAEDFLLAPASSDADPAFLARVIEIESEHPSPTNSVPIHGRTEELKARIQTSWLELRRWLLVYKPLRLSWIEGGFVLALLFLLLFGRTAPNVIQPSALEPAPEQTQASLFSAPQAASKLSFSAALAEQHQITPDQPTSGQLQSESPAVQPPTTFLPPEQNGSGDKKRPTPDAREKLDKPSQKPSVKEHDLPTLLARAERQAAALHQAAELLTVEVERSTNRNEEVADLAPQGTEDSRRATTLLARAQQYEETLHQAVGQLKKDTTGQTHTTSDRLAALLTQAKHHETLLRQTTTQLQTSALRRVKVQLREEKERFVKNEQSSHEDLARATDVSESKQPEFDPPSQEERGDLSQTGESSELPSPSFHNNTQGWTPLMLAALQGDEDAVRRLLIHGAEVNAINRAGGSALMTAALQGHHEVIRLLIAKGAILNAKNDKGWTALMYAAWNGHTDVVKTLLAKGAAVNAQSAEGWTALMYATWKGQSETVRALLAGQALVSTPNEAGESALTLAAHRGNVDITMLLNDADGRQ